QMLQKVRILEPGETEFLEGEHVDRQVFREENDRAKKKKESPATAEPLLLGITKASLTTQSFISAASFQETTRVLTDASIRGAKDDLLGLKENIIIGHLIPAGTGMYRYQEVDIEMQQQGDFELRRFQVVEDLPPIRVVDRPRCFHLDHDAVFDNNVGPEESDLVALVEDLDRRFAGEAQTAFLELIGKGVGIDGFN